MSPNRINRMVAAIEGRIAARKDGKLRFRESSILDDATGIKKMVGTIQVSTKDGSVQISPVQCLSLFSIGTEII